MGKWKGSRASRAALVVVAVVMAAPAAAAPGLPGDPELAYWTPTEVVVADGAGSEVRRFPDFAKMSLGGGVLAGEIVGDTGDQARIVAFDASTGERLYRIRNARLPVVVGRGRKVAFLPTFHRDDTGMSVWMRMASGRLRKIARFKTRGVPGIRHGMRAGVAPLDVAFDQSGRKMALVGGLEPLRSFDVWLVDTKSKEATRMTRGENSHNPSLSPDASMLAVRVESPEPCPDPIYGEILIGKIRIISTVTGERSDLTEFGCDLFYDTPRWIDNDTLAAVRVTKDPTETDGYDLDIVTFDAATGEETELITEGNPCCITVSPTLRKVAYAFSDSGGFAVHDLDSGATIEFPGEAYVPHLSDESRF